ncbi:MAG: methyltransferase domain-containing protein [Theionarchaea archaeon]|nr:methyltransferase domain-containing protein [Theionarchaea archaeon]
MSSKGDSKVQAGLRDEMIKKGTNVYNTIYTRKIRPVLNKDSSLLDIGCGTGHVIQQLALYEHSLIVGLDISSAMLEKARTNTAHLQVILVEGDGLNLPFHDCTFDVVITRLADYAVKEVYRILKKGGYFFEYGLGPEADKEIAEFFPDRIDEEAFFFPKTNKWKEEVMKDLKETGFAINGINDYKEIDYYQNEQELMDLIEMVPLVKNFDREKDRKTIDELARKYKSENGIEITWHYYVLEAQIPFRNQPSSCEKILLPCL